MAKLSANHQKELWRVELERHFQDGRPYTVKYAYTSSSKMLRNMGFGWSVMCKWTPQQAEGYKTQLLSEGGRLV